MTPFQRILPAAYDIGLTADNQRAFKPRGYTWLQSPRLLSTMIHDEQHKPDRRITHMVMQFGQFLDHDMALTLESEVHGGCCSKTDEPECFPIQLPNDPFFSDKSRRPAPTSCLELTRSIAYPSNATVREQFTALTAYLDASNVYGSDKKLASKLRYVENKTIDIKL